MALFTTIDVAYFLFARQLSRTTNHIDYGSTSDGAIYVLISRAVASGLDF